MVCERCAHLNQGFRKLAKDVLGHERYADDSYDNTDEAEETPQGTNESRKEIIKARMLNRLAALGNDLAELQDIDSAEADSWMKELKSKNFENLAVL
jgi:hypothetical protein